jgi:hypothetical protein
MCVIRVSQRDIVEISELVDELNDCCSSIDLSNYLWKLVAEAWES